MESIRISISRDTYRACVFFFPRWKTGFSHNWNKHFDSLISVKGRGGRAALRKGPFAKQSKTPATEMPFYFLYRCQVLNRHPIYYLVSWLIRVDTNRAEICLTYCSQGFFHALAQSQTFHKVEGKEEGAVGVLFPVFYHQDEYDPLPFLICKTSQEITQG